MLNVLNIYENEEVALKADAIAVAIDIKKQNPDLPFVVIGDRLKFESYTIGSIRILDNIINIQPRNKVFTLSVLFEMILFNNNISNSVVDTSGYEYGQNAGLNIFPKYFYNSCKKLVDFGLTGALVTKQEHSDIIKGDIVFEKFIKQLIPVSGINYTGKFYTLDVPTNQIIKSALLKMVYSGQLSNQERVQYDILLKNFDGVSVFDGDVNCFCGANSFWSCNPYYDSALQISLTILKNMKLSFSAGAVRWYSFLHNSNALFETYIRKLVKSIITDIRVEKWDNPKQYASVVYGEKTGRKGYSPDILIGFDKMTETAKIVLDVKNKKYDPINGNVSDLVEPADMYQLMFYCRKLKTDLGGLVYPCDTDLDVAEIILNDDGDKRVVLFPVNMLSSFADRVSKLKKDLFKHLLKYS